MAFGVHPPVLLEAELLFICLLGRAPLSLCSSFKWTWAPWAPWLPLILDTNNLLLNPYHQHRPLLVFQSPTNHLKLQTSLSSSFPLIPPVSHNKVFNISVYMISCVWHHCAILVGFHTYYCPSDLLKGLWRKRILPSWSIYFIKKKTSKYTLKIMLDKSEKGNRGCQYAFFLKQGVGEILPFTSANWWERLEDCKPHSSLGVGFLIKQQL